MDDAVSYQDRGDVRLVPVVGEFDLANADRLEAMIEAALYGEKPVIVDFTSATPRM